MFDRVDGSRRYNLYKEITTLQEGTASMAAYLTKLKSLWDESEALVPFSTCDCEKSRAFVIHMNWHKLYQFLRG